MIIISTSFKTFNIITSNPLYNGKNVILWNIPNHDDNKIIENGKYHSADFKISFEYEVIFEVNIQLSETLFKKWYDKNLSHISTNYCKVFAESAHKWEF